MRTWRAVRHVRRVLSRPATVTRCVLLVMLVTRRCRARRQRVMHVQRDTGVASHRLTRQAVRHAQRATTRPRWAIRPVQHAMPATLLQARALPLPRAAVYVQQAMGVARRPQTHLAVPHVRRAATRPLWVMRRVLAVMPVTRRCRALRHRVTPARRDTGVA